jgi:DAK2 domain fusion protein YloV
VGVDEIPFGYCTEFLLRGKDLDPDYLRKRLKRRGLSLIVVGDTSTVRVHIHTVDPGSIIHFATTLGTVHSVSMRNMDEQHQDFLEMQRVRAPVAGAEILVVAAGDGLAEVFTSLGVAGVVAGGQTMNPSTKDILQAVSKLASSKVIILPNNKNIILTAERVQQLTDKTIHVIPSKTVPQGVAAILAFDYEADFDTNTRLMTEALASVKTIEVTRAMRTTKANGLSIKKKQAIGVLDDHEIISVSDEPEAALYGALAKIKAGKSEVVTVYFGSDTSEEQAQKVRDEINARYPHLQVEVVRGGQPHYNYIVSVE